MSQRVWLGCGNINSALYCQRERETEDGISRLVSNRSHKDDDDDDDGDASGQNSGNNGELLGQLLMSTHQHGVI